MAMSTEREKMLAGELYDPLDPDLAAARRRARLLCKQFNETPDDQPDRRRRILQELLATGGEDAWIEPPFFCDYGRQLELGRKVYLNFNCVVLDVCRVRIGDNTLIGPAVQIYAATHPVDAATRRSGLELGKPVDIGADVWIGGGAVICPGVRIGDRAVIGAGSVVTRSIPGDCIAAGNPCRVRRTLG